MDRVRALPPKVREQDLRTVGRLLNQQFAHRRVAISAIKPETVRKFIAQQDKLYVTPASACCIASALRGYFRYRSARGDRMHHRIGVVNFPATWQLASLPKALSAHEVARLLDSLGGSYPSARRSDAIVRCALDLGLRVGEIANLCLDDIDWHAGTFTLRATKSRREETLAIFGAPGDSWTSRRDHMLFTMLYNTRARVGDDWRARCRCCAGCFALRALAWQGTQTARDTTAEVHRAGDSPPGSVTTWRTTPRPSSCLTVTAR
jgi:integrase/recombinase XerC